jgi:acyl-CoA thioesterase
MGDLGIDTAVSGRDGRYTAQLTRDWEIWGPNGGYIGAIALRAAGAHSRFDRPVTLVGHFLGVAAFEPVDIEVTTLREAKRAESIRVSMTQHGQPIFDAMVWAVGEVGGFEHDVTEMPDVPEPLSLPSNAERFAEAGIEQTFRFWENFDQRSPIWIDDWENREPREPEFSQWYRYVPRSTFPDDPWLDACRSLILLDTLGWPAASQLHPRVPFIAPSIDLSVAFHRAMPDEPWLYGQATAPSANAGIVACESRVWARTGELLAVGASQLLCRPARPQ